MGWTKLQVQALYDLPFLDLLYQAATVHRENFNSNEIELCSLYNYKVGGCPENCGYCSQSAHYKTGLKKETNFDIEKLLEYAKAQKQNGSIRVCMGAAWRNPNARDFPKVLEMIKAVKALGMETCVTLGMLSEEQAHQLKEAGLDYYNHNLDTSERHYKNIVTTRTYQDRLDTLEHVRNAGINQCCGYILGMGETREDRVDILLQLASLPKIPPSIPINHLMPMNGTPLANSPKLEKFEFIRTIAAARIMMHKSMIRLSAGRINMSEEEQALCFMAGANSMWLGDKLLTAANPHTDKDQQMFTTLGLTAKVANDSQ